MKKEKSTFEEYSEQLGLKALSLTLSEKYGFRNISSIIEDGQNKCNIIKNNKR